MIAGSTGPGPVPSIWSRWRDSCGEAHLTLDAVVAHVDGELAPGPAQRATEHVQRCLLCAGEVAAQRRTRGLLREADAPGAPSGLLSALRAIPDEPPAPPSPAGLGPGQRPGQSPGQGPGAGRDDDPGAGDDVGHGPGPDLAAVGRGRRRRGERSGLRRGLPVAVASGIALGSVALAAVPALPMTSPIARSVAPGSPAGRGVPGADAFAVLSHRAGGVPAPTAATGSPSAAVPTTTGVPITTALPTTTAPPAAASTTASRAGH